MNGSQETFNKMTSDSDLWEGDENTLDSCTLQNKLLFFWCTT